MTKKKGDYKIPFQSNGSLCHYPGWPTDAAKWRKNFVFEAWLVYITYQRGRSAAYLVFQEVGTKKTYPMFLTVFDQIVHRMRDGCVSGRWTFRKTGTNYSICPAEDKA